MKHPILPKVIWVTALFLGMGPARPAFAQHGGHLGAGFHGGAGHVTAAHPNGSISRTAYGYRAAYGYRGAHHAVRGGYAYGWHAGYWGYPRYGYGFTVGFGWPYYWPYAYPAGFWWGSPYPYYYPYYVPYSAPPVSPYDSGDNPPERKAIPQESAPQPNDHASPGDSDTPARQGSPENEYVPSDARNVQRIAALQIAGQTVRPQVLRAIEALREMPPYVREREIDHGRYSSFSPEEKELLRSLDPLHKRQPAPLKPELQ